MSPLRDTAMVAPKPHIWAVATQTPGEPLYVCKGQDTYSWGLTRRNAYEKWLTRIEGQKK